MVNMSSNEWRNICLELQDFHAVFYKIWEIGKPYFSTETETACVNFDKEGKYINFVFNPEFWQKCTKYKKMFVICHESLHILLNHGYRFKDAEYHKLANYAMDVAINHALISRFGFDRNSIEGQEKYCWVDTVFPNEKYQGFPMPDDETAEFYYSQLIKKNKKQSSKENKSGSEGNPKQSPESGNEPETLDAHDFLKDSNNNISKITKALNSSLSNEEKQDFLNKVKGHQCGKKAGVDVGGISFDIEPSNNQIKRKWESVITNWTKKYLKESEVNKEQWARKHRRHQFLDSSLFLPSDMDVEDISSVKDKIDVYFFLDTSGSCIGYKERFFNAAKTLNPKKFNVNLFCFDTKVFETDIKSNRVYGGGGTNFNIIEQYIQKHKGEKPYPDSVWILTDGEGTSVLPQIPEKWHWFITEYGSDQFVHEKSKKYKLDDFS